MIVFLKEKNDTLCKPAATMRNAFVSHGAMQIRILILTLLLFGILASPAIAYQLEISYPTIDGHSLDADTTLTDFIKYIYTVSMYVVGVAAFIALAYGGVIYMMSDTLTSKEDGKAWIRAALTGLGIALASYLILYTINPDLVQFRAPDIPENPSPDPPGPPPEPPEPPEGPEKYDHYTAAILLSDYGIILKPGASLEDINKDTVDALIRLLTECPNSNIEITSGTEGKHAPGTYSHANGYKVDIARDADLDNCITTSLMTKPGATKGSIQIDGVSHDTYTVIIDSYEYRFIDYPPPNNPHWCLRVIKQ